MSAPPRSLRGPAPLRVVALALAPVLLAISSSEAEPISSAPETAFRRTESREPCADSDPLRRPFFGDTHVHTTFSFDAWGQGTLVRPRDAYRYARGETIGLQPYDEQGNPSTWVRLRRPLDFAVVTDHSDLLGEARICRDAGLEGYDSLVCRVVRRFPRLGYILVNGHVYSHTRPERYAFCGPDGAWCREAGRGPWQETQQAAEDAYDRSASCRFTSFVGYEWTGMPEGKNQHRNVIFRNENVQAYPTTFIETPTAEGLWTALEEECLEGQRGCDVIAIPHNSNVSGGEMWPITRADGSPITAGDGRLRARLETLVEVTQHKGDSECRPTAEDELCAFETLDGALLSDVAQGNETPIPSRVYAREALGEGLRQEQRIGVNPFRFGLIGATDTHFGTPGMVDEDEFKGHAAGAVSSRRGPLPYPDAPWFNPGGLAGLWAEENSRDALFAAMHRREAFGTSGPRITLRFFAGWDYAETLCSDPDLVAKGYAGGVPMGGELVAGPGSPRFIVSAHRDPGGHGVPSTPLQRIQIVKGWVEQDAVHERVFDVAGDPGNGATVDLATCSPRGPGFDDLCTVWTDPDFDPEEPAYYYARVVENPSCRWNAWVCNARNVDCSEPGSVPRALRECCNPDVPRTIQERAWSSPIWIGPDPHGNEPDAGAPSVLDEPA
ncbi:MAG: DUF3604 domain-containing protein [bacterium]